VAAAVDAERLEESDRYCVRRLLAGVLDHPTGRTSPGRLRTVWRQRGRPRRRRPRSVRLRGGAATA